MNLGAHVGFIAVLFGLLLVAVVWRTSIYRECRAFGHSTLYCIAMSGR